MVLAMWTLPGSNFFSDWKLITIQIGSNDQCSSCNDTNGQYTPTAYGKYLRAAVQTIQQYIPNVIVNLSNIIFDEYVCKAILGF
jgi:phospholipase B1